MLMNDDVEVAAFAVVLVLVIFLVALNIVVCFTPLCQFAQIILSLDNHTIP